MKIRKGFISNSSSTSFICDVCGENVSGMDMGLEEAEMYECENGHTFCRIESIGDAVMSEDGERVIEERTFVANEDDDEAYNVPAKHCPCCTFNSVSPRDLTDYLLKKAGTNKDDVTKELKKKFTHFNDFLAYVLKKE